MEMFVASIKKRNPTFVNYFGHNIEVLHIKVKEQRELIMSSEKKLYSTQF